MPAELTDLDDEQLLDSIGSRRSTRGDNRAGQGLGVGGYLGRGRRRNPGDSSRAKRHSRPETCSAGLLTPGSLALRQTDVTLHGHRIAYRVAGDPGLPVLLLIHGITSSSATWDPVIEALAEHAHVIAPDLLGHGDSDKPRGDYSLGGFASGLRDLLEYLGHERVTIVGHSLGGGVAMQLAYQYPQYCERLVLVASGGLGREVSWALRAGTLPGADLLLPFIANTHVRAVGSAVGRLIRALSITLRPSVLEMARGYASLADSPARSAFVHTLRSVIEPGGQRVAADARHFVAAARPTLIVWGAQDPVIPLAHAHTAQTALPGSVLQVFEQSHHFPHMDEPARFARVLLAFLAASEPARIGRALLRDQITNRSQAIHAQQHRARLTPA